MRLYFDYDNINQPASAAIKQMKRRCPARSHFLELEKIRIEKSDRGNGFWVWSDWSCGAKGADIEKGRLSLCARTEYEAERMASRLRRI